MRIAILHFHLRAGGVTRVIEMACEALLAQGCEVLVVSGEPSPPGCRVPAGLVEVVPDLAYGIAASRSGQLSAAIDAAVRRHWQNGADVLHLHNHSLGKNFALPLVVQRWADDGRALLLQIHDFAENGRPENYRRLLAELGGAAGLSRCLYPTAPRIGYAVLNSADRARLASAGLDAGGDLLPNPVSLPASGGAVRAADLGAESLLVYPTRGIRRKNLGEALLWAAMAGPGEKVILTAGAAGGDDARRHAEWEAFAERLRLPVVFDAQSRLKRPAVDFLQGADLCLTTSVAEGFGMAFLEPWLAGRGLCGRDLPGITRDFREEGLVLDGLSPRCSVPPYCVGDYSGLLRETILRACAAYGIPFQEAYLRAAAGSVQTPEGVDFGRLDETLQRRVIRAVVEGRAKADIRRPVIPARVVDGNRTVVAAQYALPRSGSRLKNLYQRLLAAAPARPAPLDAGRLLHATMQFGDFFALRS